MEQLIASAIWHWGEDQDRPTSDLESRAHELQEQLCLALGEGAAEAAFGVIEHIGGSFETEDPELGVEHLGKAMCHAAAHAYAHGLAIAPIIALARTFTRRSDVHAVHGATRLAAVERADDPGPAQIVEALAMCVAKGIDDCEIVHGLTIEPLGLFLVVGKEVLAAADKLADGHLLLLDSAFAKSSAVAGKLGDDGTPHVPDTGPGAFKFPRDRISITKGNDETLEAFTARAIEFTTTGQVIAAVNPRGICPQCAAPMSPLGDTGYRCSNGHELTMEQMDALTGSHASTANSSE